MKMLRYLFAIVLVSGIGSVAKADDFKMVVIDPPAIPANLINHIYTDDFTFTFPSTGPQAGCHASQLFGLSPAVYLGCFTGENDTGSTITSLEMFIPVFDYQGLQQAGCSPVPQDIFSDISCGFTADQKSYFLSFSGGKGIPSTVGNADCDHDNDGGSKLNDDDAACNAPSIFTIAEAGVPPADFPPVHVIANAAIAPEPNSLLFLSTGVLSGGFFLVRRRQYAASSSAPGN